MRACVRSARPPARPARRLLRSTMGALVESCVCSLSPGPSLRIAPSSSLPARLLLLSPLRRPPHRSLSVHAAFSLTTPCSCVFLGCRGRTALTPASSSSSSPPPFVTRGARPRALLRTRLFGPDWRIHAQFLAQANESRSQRELVVRALSKHAVEEAIPFLIDALESDRAEPSGRKSNRRSSNSGASSVASGVRLEHISKTFKGGQVLKDVSWEVKKGERVGLVGVNGAGADFSPPASIMFRGKL